MLFHNHSTINKNRNCNIDVMLLCNISPYPHFCNYPSDILYGILLLAPPIQDLIEDYTLYLCRVSLLIWNSFFVFRDTDVFEDL